MRLTDHLLPALLLLVFCFACDEEARLEAVNPAETSVFSLEKKKKGTALPMRATFYTEIDLEAIQNGEKDCSGSAEFPFPNVQVGGGNALHLGKFTTTLKFCGVPATPEEAAEGLFFRYGELEGSFEAANGDLLHIGLVGAGEIYVSDAPGYDLEFFDTFTIEGGTGRFEDASGWMTSSSFVNQTTQRTDHVWTGEISLNK